MEERRCIHGGSHVSGLQAEISDAAKLIVNPEDPLSTAELLTIPLVGPASRCGRGSTCPIDLNCCSAGPGSVAASSGGPADVWAWHSSARVFLDASRLLDAEYVCVCSNPRP